MQLFVLAVITFGALILFATEKLRADLVAVMVAAALALTGLVTVEQAFAGFGSPAVVTVAGIFVMSAGLMRTGGSDHLTRLLRRLGGRGERRLIAATVLLVGLLSSIMNNIGAAIIMMPAVLAAGRDAKVPAGRLLIPLAFGSLLGGLTTAVGTPPNLLVNAALTARGYAPFGLFDFTPTGLAVLGAGAVFLAVLGPRLLPAREPSSGAGGEGAGIGQNHALSTEVLVAPPQADARRVRQITAELGLTVLAVLRPVDDGLREMAAARGETPAPADAGGAPAARALLVEGPRDSLLRAAAARQVHLLAELKHPPDPGGNGRDIRLAEATLAPRSTLAGKTLRETDFYHRYGLTVIGIRRHGETIRQPLARVRLRFGDTLLLRGPRDRIRRLGPDPDFLLLEPVENPAPDYSRAGRAAAIFGGAIGLAAAGVLHVSLAAALGAVAMVVGGCLRIEEAHRAIDWRTIIAIGGMLPLGTALETTGAATLLAEWLARLGADAGPGAGAAAVLPAGLPAARPLAACALIGAMTIALTQILTNAAAAILMAPIALNLAEALAISPYPVMMIVAIAASTAFATPVGHQSNMLVYNAGAYRFTDFVKVGLPLTLVILAVSLALVPLIWPF